MLGEASEPAEPTQAAAPVQAQSEKVPAAIAEKQKEAKAAQKVAEERSLKARMANTHATKLSKQAEEMTKKHKEKVVEVNHKKVEVIKQQAKKAIDDASLRRLPLKMPQSFR